MKNCIDCGKEGVFEKKRCKECDLVYNRNRAKRYYKKRKESGREFTYYGISTCVVCGEPMILNHRNQQTHGKCKSGLSICNSNYNVYPRNKKGETIANGMVKDIFICAFPKDIVVHHIDGDPTHNYYSNFLIMNRKDHAKLHSFLRKERSLWLKSESSKDENCWKLLIVQKTTTWLEMASVIRVKISEIGQSASELLNLIKQEEGSETMYVLSVTDDAVDKDIVQTPTTVLLA